MKTVLPLSIADPIDKVILKYTFHPSIILTQNI